MGKKMDSRSITRVSNEVNAIVPELKERQVVRWNIKQQKNYSEEYVRSDIRLGEKILYHARYHGNLTLFSVEA